MVSSGCIRSSLSVARADDGPCRRSRCRRWWQRCRRAPSTMTLTSTSCLACSVPRQALLLVGLERDRCRTSATACLRSPRRARRSGPTTSARSSARPADTTNDTSATLRLASTRFSRSSSTIAARRTASRDRRGAPRGPREPCNGGDPLVHRDSRTWSRPRRDRRPLRGAGRRARGTRSPRCGRGAARRRAGERLADALRATGKQVEVKVVVDPTVLGGIVASIGDTVIDGTVRTASTAANRSEGDELGRKHG